MIETNARLTYAGWTAAIVSTGLLCRWPALGLPWVVAKYAGSTLWGTMVYAGLRAINPRAKVSESVTAAIATAICVEFFRLYHQPALDSFRATLAGQLLLGRIFSLRNVVAYAIGIACFAFADERTAQIRNRRRPTTPTVAPP
jgi:hypothetical protein